MPESLPVLSAAELSRYSRHILLDEIGVEGQQRLAAGSVLVIGAGGLGSPAALYRAAAGVGQLGIADLDRVESHNLQRQLLHDTASVGEPKVASAARRLRGLNPHIHVIEHPDGITAANAQDIFSGYDVIVDGTDNFAARYVNNDAAFAARKPLVFGSVFKFEGQVTVFDPAREAPCYRCLFPEPPTPGSVPGCGEAGVLGALCGVIGSLQALEALKLVARIGQPLRGRLLTYDALTQTMRTFELRRDPACPTCGKTPPGAGKRIASSPATHSALSMTPADYPFEVPVVEAKRLLQNPANNATLIDVREPWETEICRVAGAELIPMRRIPEQLPQLPRDRHLLVMCHHGARSANVVQFLRSHGFNAVTNIEGGIAAWAEQLDPTMTRY
ncbi:MAG TPA: molybdopterin-synthase adenylyltransferase MoeB [Opitutus sp.]|nr:molybdopterin-synthase adenylyltransferase MoeB [Opitutus sp.]